MRTLKIRRVKPVILAAAAGAALASASVAHAQSSWAGAVSDSWFNPNRWSPNGVPNSASTNVTLGLSGAYTVSMQNSSASCGTLTLTDSSAALDIFDNAGLSVNGNISNAGLIQISDLTAPGDGTHLDINTNLQISGAGTLRLAASGSSGDSDAGYLYYGGSAANTLTNGSGHTIAGYGRIYASITNNGTVNADQNGRGLFMISQPKTNNATMTASNGGVLQFRSIGLTQGSSGVCLSSTNSLVQFVSASVSGGTLNGAGTNSGIQFYGANNADNLTLQNSVQVTDNSGMYLGANGIVNNGIWTISNPGAPGDGTYVDLNAPAVTLGGSGTLRLQGPAGGTGDSDAAYVFYTNSADVLTNASTHSIAGYGRLYANIVNNGTINADNTPNAGGPASKGLYLMDQPKTNNATITSSNGGYWYVRNITVTNGASGVMSSSNTATPGGYFESCTITNGAISNISSQYFATAGSVTINGSTLTTGSGIQVNDNSGLYTSGLTNNGTILVSSPSAPGDGTHVIATAPTTTISGNGAIRLQGPGNGDSNTSYLDYTAAANQFVIPAGQSVLGNGRIYPNVLNNGVMRADQSGKGMYFVDQPKTNNATITSSSSGYWYIRGITLTNGAGGVMSSSNTTTPGGGLESCTITNGTFTNVSSQYFGIAGSVTVNGSTVSTGSGLQINDNAGLYTSGLTNNGTILVSSPSAPGDGTHLVATAASTTIAGNGTVRLQGPGNGDSNTSYLDYTAAANQFVIPAGQSVLGNGRIYPNVLNNGVMQADQSSKGMYFVDQPKTNNATITSSGGGYWYIRGITLTNGASGVMSSSNTTTPGGGFESCTIAGGSMTNVSGQAFGIAGGVLFDGVTITSGSAIQVNDNSNLQVGATGLVNNGTVYVESIGAPGNGTYLTAGSAAAVSGTGAIRLQPTGFNNNSAYLWGQGDTAHPLTLGPGQTLSGSGRFFGNVVLNGAISPDQPFGTATAFGLFNPVGGTTVLGATSVFNCQLGAPGVYDAIQGNSDVTIATGATLNVSIPNGYDPSPGATFDIITGNSVTGTFTNVNFPNLLNKKQAFLIYGPNFVRLYVTCYANCDLSTNPPLLNANDFNCFLNKYAANDPYANCDGSTVPPILNANDFNCFLNKYAAGCN